MGISRFGVVLLLVLSGCSISKSDFFSEADKEKLRSSYLDETYHKFAGYEEICIIAHKALKYDETSECENTNVDSIALIDANGECSVYPLGEELGRAGSYEYEMMCEKTSTGLKLCVFHREGQEHLVLTPKSDDICDD